MNAMNEVRARVALGLEAMTIRQALESCEQAAGPLLREVQGQIDLERARGQAFKLSRRMLADVGDYRRPSWATLADGAADGVATVQMWRAGHDQPGQDRGAARVSWVALVASVSRDIYGESEPEQAARAGWLWWYSVQGLAGGVRSLIAGWRREHLAKRRAARLDNVLAVLGRGRGRRRAAADKIGHAARLLLAGVPANEAATAAGFAPSGRASAVDRLARALRRMGRRVQLDLRMRGEAFGKASTF